ncbi:hypothetical protein F4819DRAFT_398079 [Hypoxylon fuscum]|nr:hypothetical protein F4819DRAFT_398079 [Hypoxylon fuscum]
MDQQREVDANVEEGRRTCSRIDPLQQAHTLIRCIRHSIQQRSTLRRGSYPAISSIPRTSPERLARASPDSPDNDSASTVLYLAYGSNLSSETFFRMRGIRPISQINVSAPGFDLVFDLPGLPYWEPCFSNVAPRKIPKPPFPGDPPKNPFPPPGTISDRQEDVMAAGEGHAAMPLLPSLPPDGGPTWSKGLYGVVYEVTREDYSRIIRTEGGGSSYHDILTPCLALPPPFHVPEKPPIPELPRPFVAHTLYAPRLPDLPGDGDGDHASSDDGDGKDNRWWQKLLLPVHRPEPDYAQASLRYLNLIRDGAREHYLPDDYQAYLARLQSYTITTWQQQVGRWLFMLMVLPFFALHLLLSQIFANKDGSLPRWLAAASTVLMNLIWMAYDTVFKPVFGDGERTIEEDDIASSSRRGRGIINVGNAPAWGTGSEKNALLADW